MVIIHNDNKKSIISVFDQVRTVSVPAIQKIGFYGRLTDMEGEYKFTIRIVSLADGGEEVIAGAETAPVRVEDRLSILDIPVNLPPIALPKFGLYEVQLFWENIYLGRATMNVVKIEQGG
jgi:hypothetical protein